MLIKLDSGDYINTMYVIKTMTDTAGSVGKKSGQLVYLLDTGYQKITPADKDRIVAAMTEAKRPITDLDLSLTAIVQHLSDVDTLQKAGKGCANLQLVIKMLGELI